MRFKKNELLLRTWNVFFYICMAVPLILSLVYSKMLWDLFSLCFIGLIVILVPFELASKGGLFHDTVYCDDHGIKITMRKNTYNFLWEDIELLELVYGVRGNGGWIIHLFSQKEIYIGVVTKKFIKYVKKIAPDVKIQERG